jgi:predicted nucleotidyltransferase
MKRLELAKEFARTLKDAATERIILYGSVARGEDTEESDVDILVLSRDKRATRKQVIKRAIDVLLDTGTYISVKVLTPGEYEQLQDTHFIRQIREEGVVIG